MNSVQYQPLIIIMAYWSPFIVNGVKVFEDQPKYACDNPDLGRDSLIGSRIGRIKETNTNRNQRPEFVFVLFCRRGYNFTQMID